MHLKVLVSDPIAAEGIAILEGAADVDVRTGLSKEELVAIIGDYDALAVRSETKVTAEILDAAKNLKIIGRAGVGVDNIDVARATELGILVVNSPEGNTIAASELTVAMLLALARNIVPADAALRNGEWKRSKYVGVEVYNKTLGVVGLGKIGREVTRRLQAFGMQVLAFDPYVSEEIGKQLGVTLVDLETIYKNADYITLHIPKTKDTAGMIGAAELARMKQGVRIVNVARGGLIDEAALASALKSGHVGGAAIDVYSTEPVASDNPLLGLPNVIHTPHLGASTEEAQINVAIDIAEQIVDVLGGKPARAAVNMPSVSPEVLQGLHPYLILGEKIGSLQAQLAGGRIDKVEVLFGGDFGDLPTVHIVRAVLKGVLGAILAESVNYVNAPTLAQRLGMQVIESRKPVVETHTCLLTVRVQSGDYEREICGSVFAHDDIRIVHIDGFRVDIKPFGSMIFTEHNDRPGVIGKVGTLLGENNINIGGMHVGRAGTGQRALMALLIDEPAPDSIVQEIKTLAGMEWTRQVQL